MINLWDIEASNKAQKCKKRIEENIKIVNEVYNFVDIDSSKTLTATEITDSMEIFL